MFVHKLTRRWCDQTTIIIDASEQSISVVHGPTQTYMYRPILCR